MWRAGALVLGKRCPLIRRGNTGLRFRGGATSWWWVLLELTRTDVCIYFGIYFGGQQRREVVQGGWGQYFSRSFLHFFRCLRAGDAFRLFSVLCSNLCLPSRETCHDIASRVFITPSPFLLPPLPPSLPSFLDQQHDTKNKPSIRCHLSLRETRKERRV